MNPKNIIHELDRTLKEIRPFREMHSQYYVDMMYHLNNMSIRTLLEFTSSKVSNANLEHLNTLMRIIRSTKK